MLAIEQRQNEDDRTLGELFFYFVDELADITFAESMRILITAMLDSISAIFRPTEKQIEMFIAVFIGRLPEYIRRVIPTAALEA